MKGRVHSVQSLGAVDGPGLRYVVFLQGCPLRCVYCHNPDTWDPSLGTEMEPKELLQKILRCKPYFGHQGGVTVTGGEPLLQPDFTAELFALLRENGIHTALDTSGNVGEAAFEKVLPYTDLVLADLKFAGEEEYAKYCKGNFNTVRRFLKRTEEMKIPLWIRHVVVPGITAKREYLETISAIAHTYTNLEKIEWLPFHTMCLEKYRQMGIPFPLENTPAMDENTLKQLTESL